MMNTDTIGAYQRTFDSVDGKIVLDDLRRMLGFRSSFTPNPYVTAFHEGQRDILLRIEFLLRKAADPTYNPPSPISFGEGSYEEVSDGD